MSTLHLLAMEVVLDIDMFRPRVDETVIAEFLIYLYINYIYLYILSDIRIDISIKYIHLVLYYIHVINTQVYI